MTTLLVTGCAGFIGSNFCQLFANDFTIIGVDCMGRGSHPANISSAIKFHDLDISCENAVNELLSTYQNIDGIINFAAESHVDFSLHNDKKFWSSNVEGVRHLARAALNKKIRLVHVSTDEVYGPSDNGEHFTENSPLDPRNPYAASKASGELLVRSYHAAYKLDAVISRGCNTMGPRQFPDKVVPKAISYFLADKPFPLYKTPARRLWIDAADHCRAIKVLFEKGRSGEIYNIAPSGDNEIETLVLVETVRKLIGKGTIQEVADRASYDLRYLMSADKIQNELNWSAKTKLSELIENTVKWYLENLNWLNQCSI